MRPFVYPRDGSDAFIAGLSTPERLVLAQVTGDVVELLGGEDGYWAAQEDRDEDDDGQDDDGPDDDGQHDGLPDADGDADSVGPVPGEPTAEAISALWSTFDGIESAPVEAPVDPAVRRLLPDASSDPEIAGEFRRYTDDDLRQRKVERLLLFAELLLEVPPSPDESDQLDFVVMAEEAEAIAGALADIRLVIGERLELRSDADSEELYDAVTATWTSDEAGEDPEPHAGEGMSGPRLFLGSVFLLAGYLQESLTDCMIEDFRNRKRRH